MLGNLRGHRSSLPIWPEPNLLPRKRLPLTCNGSDDHPHKLMWGDLQVLNLNMERGEMTISLPISYSCYSGGKQMTNQRAYYQTTLIEHSTFTFSNKNKFTTIGCDTLGLFSGSWGKSFTGGCATYCSVSSLDANSSSCDGVGCCQTTIPKGVRQANINISSFDNYKFSRSPNDLSCGYAFIVREDNFTFHPDIDLQADQLLQRRPTMPVLVDWAIGGQDDTCKTSTDQKGAGGSGCLAKHSECISLAAGYGYRCNCSKGYHGNPHLENDGCQDINECENPDLHNCTSRDTCVNMDGGYSCKCPDGQRGNGTKGGGECRRDIPLAYKAIAACVSCMFLLLGVGRLVIRFNLTPKWVINAIKKAFNQKVPDASSSTGKDMPSNAKQKKRYPVVEEEYSQAAKKCKKKLRTLIAENRCAPIMLYLAWQDVNKKAGKPFGTFNHQFADEDIEKAVNLLSKLKGELSFNKLSDADIFQLAGVVAVEVAGGPDVAFHPGREDNAENMNPDSGTKDGNAETMRSHDIVAISPWLKCKKNLPGFQFTWPPTFDNSHFEHLKNLMGCLPDHDQALVKKESLPDHEQALLDYLVQKYAEDEASFFADYVKSVKKYAEYEPSFFADYAESHRKLSELGFADAD